MNIKKIIILLSLVSFLSCSTDVDIMDCESEQLHTCYATFNIKESSFFDDISSRTADGSWFNAITDNLSLRFHNQDGSVSIGYAIYNKEKEFWEVSYKGSITSKEKQKVELFLVRGASTYRWDDYISFYETTCYYSDSEGEYVRNSNGEISIQATLKPLTGRIRFKGVPGDIFTLSGLSTSNYYDIKTGQLSVNDSPITLSIESNGYSSYIYGNFTNIISPTMSITTDDCTFTANCPTSMLNVGKSGWMKLPSRQEHTGWVIENQNNSIDGHEYVDLGLPSGTLWATCNVGASTPEGYGGYYAWGEIKGNLEGKNYFDWGTYQWCNGSWTTFTKYCTTSDDGYVDNKTELDLSDDVARQKWGENWRIPSKEQINELINECTSEIACPNGVYGRIITSKRNGNSIFLPAANSWRYGGTTSGNSGYYWSRTLGDGSSTFAYSIFFYQDPSISNIISFREEGHCIRPVLVQE